jgi:uncharacterized YigZ family protein
MVMDKFWSIKGATEGLYKEKGSKFFAYAFPVSNTDEVKENLDILKKKHFNARHHCYAYMLHDKELFRSYDDGEPRHTAGDPILNQIRSTQLKNVLVVVVRYFGGTKLGKGGLINAYKSAAKDALSNAEIIEKTIQKLISINFNYEGMNDVIHAIQQENYKVIHQHYDKDCSITCAVPVSKIPQFRKKLEALNNVIKIELLPG